MLQFVKHQAEPKQDIGWRRERSKFAGSVPFGRYSSSTMEMYCRALSSHLHKQGSSSVTSLAHGRLLLVIPYRKIYVRNSPPHTCSRCNHLLSAAERKFGLFWSPAEGQTEPQVFLCIPHKVSWISLTKLCLGNLGCASCLHKTGTRFPKPYCWHRLAEVFPPHKAAVPPSQPRAVHRMSSL